MAFFRAVFDKLKQGLTKTRQSVAVLRNVLLGRTLSAELLDELQTRMIQADFGLPASRALVEKIRQAWKEDKIHSGDDAWAFLKSLLMSYWPPEDRELHTAPSGGGPTVILVAGINGAGKTTSIAKIAKTFRDQGKSVMLAAADTFRAAAVEQLQIWSDRLGVEVIKGKQGGDPAAVAFDACQAAANRGVDVLIIDTAGRLHTQTHLMRQLVKIRDVVRKKFPSPEGSAERGAPHEVLLVLDATIGQNAIEQAKAFMAAIEVTGIFLAKLDGTAKGGVVVAIRQELGIPVKLIGVGETPQDVQPFDPASFVEALLADEA
ncbi:MAG: signal recognition particle-docking protein FtsY [Phycisphaeraceae bacterium]|nr:signal recognition particle-docking protein FtsY [Phycisphaeraceae bacterium]